MISHGQNRSTSRQRPRACPSLVFPPRPALCQTLTRVGGCAQPMEEASAVGFWRLRRSYFIVLLLLGGGGCHDGVSLHVCAYAWSSTSLAACHFELFGEDYHSLPGCETAPHSHDGAWPRFDYTGTLARIMLWNPWAGCLFSGAVEPPPHFQVHTSRQRRSSSILGCLRTVSMMYTDAGLHSRAGR